MLKNYVPLNRGWALWLVALVVLLGAAPARAQSGPVGNEWIVPGQSYYKVKILKDGLYKLDYQYLTQAGINGVAPGQLQIWRRGQEVATYLGGNAAVLDPTSFLEFYAEHNDGRLDVELYKRAQDQPHQYYNFYTDTASYFITWNSTRAGRRMAQPLAAGAAVHPHRLHNQLNLRISKYLEEPANASNYLPWVEAAEGYFDGGGLTAASDSVIRNVATTGPLPKLEVLMYGAKNGANPPPTVDQHAVEVLVVPPGGTPRSLGVMRWIGRMRYRQTFTFLRSDVSPAGTVTVITRKHSAAIAGDNFYSSYVRFIVPQVSRWIPSRRSVTFQNDSTLAGPATYEFDNDSIPATVVGFDVHDLHNVQRVVSTASGTRRRFVFPNANAGATHDLLLANEAFLARPPLPARRVYFRTYDPALPNFIIVTHPQLMRAAPGTANAAKSYAAYRANPGLPGVPRYDTLMVTTFQLYDQFTYGDRSWLALRHFARYMAAASRPGASRNLLLLGKGLGPSEGGGFFFANTSATTRGLGERGLDLVPASTRAVSDNLISADFANNDFVAKFNTGRLTVTTPAQIQVYLAKLREYETAGDQPWRKNVLHLAGGLNPTEFVTFRGYLEKYRAHVERPLFGGKVVATIERNTVNGSGTSLLVPADITPYLNPGLGVIQYFGHGSNTSFALDIGTPTAMPTYNNPGKYPVMMFDGCAFGLLYTSSPTFLENWLFTPNKGVIGGMGQSGFGYDYYLDASKDLLTQLMYNDPNWYGKPITAIYNETVRRLQSTPGGLFNPINNDPIATEQLLSTVWHGDPTITLYSPALPDFQVSNSSLSIAPTVAGTPVTASSTNFSLMIGVSNPLKVTTDPIEIRVTRIIGSTRLTYNQTFAQGPQGNGLYNFVLPNPPGVNVFGVNIFQVEVDYLNKVVEANESNNTAQTTFTFLRGGLTALSPVEFAIVGNNQPRLVAQTNDPAGQSRAYEFEADTSASFNSSPAIKQVSGTITATLTPNWRPTLPTVAGRDSVVWYWRVRFQVPAPDEDASWTVSSLRIIQGRTAGGWSQSHFAQFRRDQRQGVEVAPSGRWDFSTQNKPVQLRTRGGGLPGATPTFTATSGFGIIANALVPPTVANCVLNTPNLLIAVYDQRTLRPITGLAAPVVCGQAPQQFYVFGDNPTNAGDTLNNLNSSAARRAQVATFLAAVPDGAYVAVVSMNRLRWPSLTNLRAAFSTLLGSQLVNQLQNGDPFALMAQKSSAGGRVLHETGPSTAVGALPRYDQTVSLSDTLRTPSSRGTVTSVRIGPSQGWESLYHWIQREPNATSSYTLKVIGIDTLNNSTVLFNNVPAASPRRGGFALNTVSATRYPYLQLELTMQDSLGRNAPQLKEWFITYRGVPEGVVRRDLVSPTNAYDPATLLAQVAATGAITIPVVFENVSPFDFGTPLRAKVELRNGTVGLPPLYVPVPGPLRGESTVTFNARVPLVNVFGNITAKVTVNPTPKPLPEQNLFNNELNLAAFSVIDNNVPPTLDVAIDGRHILNGELVSARPVIHIQLNDEDKFRHITDRSAFLVTLLNPGQTGAPTVVDLNGSNVDFSVDITNGSVAKLTYEPGKNGPLPDGMYTLRVQGRDPSNAAAGAQEFQVKFEVVNASQISNVYPYPNPVINKARFVFTLTGERLPTNMKIQIMSLTGRVVREIFMSELGPLHIGNNISEYAWDGTDAYGDRLANGTYLYRVALDDPEGLYSHRTTAGDQAFKNDWGKLVLMR